MKHILLVILFIATFSGVAKAQPQREDIRIMQSLVAKTKKAIIMQYLTSNSVNVPGTFWNLYDDYEIHRQGIMEERIQLIIEYANVYSTLDESTAVSLAERLIENRDRADDLNKLYYKKFKKNLGGLHATALFQIELYFETAMQADMQAQIPIIGEMKIIAQQQKASTGL